MKKTEIALSFVGGAGDENDGVGMCGAVFVAEVVMVVADIAFFGGAAETAGASDLVEEVNAAKLGSQSVIALKKMSAVPDPVAASANDNHQFPGC
mmetsp:Transcript_13930/g.19852  ORF Transcript_13930/g.19852 Transcript_13930/m.19852 type:complete len:95 (-) Transcript_13930:6-290(-)